MAHFHTGKQSTADQPISFILFDFDGTLADSFDTAMNICNIMAKECNFREITQEEHAGMRHMSMKDIILKHLKVPWYRVPFLHKRGKELMTEHIDSLKPFNDIQPVLKELKAHGVRLGILTSSNQSRVERFLEKNSISEFETIYADSSLFGKDRCLKRFLSNFNLSPHNVLYVGDEVRDIQAAQRVGIRIISVSWGYNSQEALQTQKPLAIATNPHELIHHIKALINQL